MHTAGTLIVSWSIAGLTSWWTVLTAAVGSSRILSRCRKILSTETKENTVSTRRRCEKVLWPQSIHNKKKRNHKDSPTAIKELKLKKSFDVQFTAAVPFNINNLYQFFQNKVSQCDWFWLVIFLPESSRNKKQKTSRQSSPTIALVILSYSYPVGHGDRHSPSVRLKLACTQLVHWSAAGPSQAKHEVSHSWQEVCESTGSV